MEGLQSVAIPLPRAFSPVEVHWSSVMRTKPVVNRMQGAMGKMGPQAGSFAALRKNGKNDGKGRARGVPDSEGFLEDG